MSEQNHIEPAALYGLRLLVIDRDLSNTQNVILTQGSSALMSTIKRIVHLFHLCGPKEGNRIFTNPELPSVLQDICTHAGLASTILFNDSKKGWKETEKSYGLRLERVAYVKKYCDLQRFKPKVLTNRSVRNALIHIDEKLPDILSEKEGVGWFIDYVASERSNFDLPKGLTDVGYCRAYIHNESTLLHLSHELNLVELAQECEIILKIVFGVDLRAEDDALV